VVARCAGRADAQVVGGGGGATVVGAGTGLPVVVVVRGGSVVATVVDGGGGGIDVGVVGSVVVGGVVVATGPGATDVVCGAVEVLRPSRVPPEAMATADAVPSTDTRSTTARMLTRRWRRARSRGKE
jgi:hypothetical protein